MLAVGPQLAQAASSWRPATGALTARPRRAYSLAVPELPSDGRKSGPGERASWAENEPMAGPAYGGRWCGRAGGLCRRRRHQAHRAASSRPHGGGPGGRSGTCGACGSRVTSTPRTMRTPRSSRPARRRESRRPRTARASPTPARSALRWRFGRRFGRRRGRDGLRECQALRVEVRDHLRDGFRRRR